MSNFWYSYHLYHFHSYIEKREKKKKSITLKSVQDSLITFFYFLFYFFIQVHWASRLPLQNSDESMAYHLYDLISEILYFVRMESN